jgi:hypothetical protein
MSLHMRMFVVYDVAFEPSTTLPRCVYMLHISLPQSKGRWINAPSIEHSNEQSKSLWNMAPNSNTWVYEFRGEDSRFDAKDSKDQTHWRNCTGSNHRIWVVLLLLERPKPTSKLNVITASRTPQNLSVPQATRAKTKHLCGKPAPILWSTRWNKPKCLQGCSRQAQSLRLPSFRAFRFLARWIFAIGLRIP